MASGLSTSCQYGIGCKPTSTLGMASNDIAADAYYIDACKTDVGVAFDVHKTRKQPIAAYPGEREHSIRPS